MFKFFDTIIEFLRIGVSYVVNFFKQLLQLFANIAKALVQITVIADFMPAYIKVFFTAFIFVGIVYFLLGRD